MTLWGVEYLYLRQKEFLSMTRKKKYISLEDKLVAATQPLLHGVLLFLFANVWRKKTVMSETGSAFSLYCNIRQIQL